MSLRLRLTLTYLLVTLGGMLLLGGGFIALAARYTALQHERELAAQAEIYVGFVSELVRTTTELQSLAPEVAGGGIVPGDVSVRIFSPTGTLLSDSRGLGPFPSRAVLGYTSSALPLPVSQVPSRRYVARPITRGGDVLGIVELSHTMAAEVRLNRVLRGLVLQATVIATLVMALVSLLVAHSIAYPVKRLTRRAEALAAGDLSLAGIGQQQQSDNAPVQPTSSRDEIRLLARSLDHMAAQLQARIVEIEQERARLRVVLATISEGVVAIDRAGQVLFSNPAAAMLLDGASPAEIPARLAALGLPLHPASSEEHEVQIDSQNLLVTSSPVGTTALTNMDTPVPATVLVLRDITRLKELEQARTRFFRSISHDLRTPLTAIRGIIENLRDAAPDDQQATLATLEDEVARLVRLVDELLHPSSGGTLLLTERSPINLGVLAGDLCTLQQGRARRAGLQLECNIQPGVPPVYGDRDRLKQAILNLLDNALRMTPAGGQVRVQVMLVQPEQAGAGPVVQCSVADTGPGVEPALRERIWERGVQADGASGGAGLGLAIVREIAMAHGGRVWVETHAPHGACFVLELPTVISDFLY